MSNRSISLTTLNLSNLSQAYLFPRAEQGTRLFLAHALNDEDSLAFRD